MAPAVATQRPAPALSSDQWSENYRTTKLKEYLDKVETGRIAAAAAPAVVAHSGPQGKVQPLTIIDDPADWKAADLKKDPSQYTYTLTSEEVTEIHQAVAALKQRGIATEEDILALTAADYDFPRLGPRLTAIAEEVNKGRGFQLIKGFPVEYYATDRLGLVLGYWGMALAVGRPLVSQTDYADESRKTTYGSLLVHITDGRYKQRVSRGTDGDVRRLEFHSDQGATDLIALLSLQTAPSGGASKWVSALAIHNELLRRGRQDLVEALSRPGAWAVPRKRDQLQLEHGGEGELLLEETIPFNYHDGYLSIHYQSYLFQEAPNLTPLQEEAMWAVAALAEDPAFHFEEVLQPGTIEIIHNPTILHSRSEVADGSTDSAKRHLLRWWVDSNVNVRPIPPTFAPRSNVQAGGGFSHTPGQRLRFPLHPPSRPQG